MSGQHQYVKTVVLCTVKFSQWIILEPQTSNVQSQQQLHQMIRAARHGGTTTVSIPETTAVVLALPLDLPTSPYNLARNMTIRLVRQQSTFSGDRCFNVCNFQFLGALMYVISNYILPCKRLLQIGVKFECETLAHLAYSSDVCWIYLHTRMQCLLSTNYQCLYACLYMTGVPCYCTFSNCKNIACQVFELQRDRNNFCMYCYTLLYIYGVAQVPLQQINQP